MDLSTTYLGLPLKHPIVPSASPLSDGIDRIRRLEDAGASAVVLYSIFEEQIEGESHLLDHYLSYGSESFAEALDYFPDLDNYNTGPNGYLELIRKAKEATDVPIIASLNGASAGGWLEYARLMQQAGADALELNIYYIPTDPEMSSAGVEQQYLDVVSAVRKEISIPLAVKLGPYFSSFPNMAKRLGAAGAEGLVLFNRFYQPDLDIEQLEVTPNLHLSNSYEMRLPLRWVAILCDRVPVDFAITSGVHTFEDSVKGIMAGAKVTMMASELLRNGVQRIGAVVRDLERWLADHEYDSLAQMRGSMSQLRVADPTAFERANYMKVLHSWKFDPTGVLKR